MRLHGTQRRLIILAITLVIAGGLLARATLSRAGPISRTLLQSVVPSKWSCVHWCMIRLRE